MINSTTKKAPREMFKDEYSKLEKYYKVVEDEVVIHGLYYDTVEYRDNYYKLPIDKISNEDRIRIERHGEYLLFYLASSNTLLCKNKLVSGKGKVVEIKIEKKEEYSIEEVLLEEYKDSEEAIKYIKRLREQKPRYVYAQCRKIGRLKKFYTKELIIEGMRYCIEKDECSAFELISWLLMKTREKDARKYIPRHTYKHYKERAKEIRREIENNG